MVKVVLNKSFDGFGLSKRAYDMLCEIKSDLVNGFGTLDGRTYYHEFQDNRDFRTHPDLVRIVEELGEKSFGRSAKLVIEEIPFQWYIHHYDGMESIKYGAEY